MNIEDLGEIVESDGATTERDTQLVDEPTCDPVEARAVVAERGKGVDGGRLVDRGRSSVNRPVAHETQQPVRDPRRCPGRAGDDASSAGVDVESEKARRPFNDPCERLVPVRFEFAEVPEPVAERPGKLPRLRGRTDETERPDRDTDDIVDDGDVDDAVFERRIQELLDRGCETVDLVDEHDRRFVDSRQDRRQVPSLGDRRPRGDNDRMSKLGSDDVRERRLPGPRGTRKQKVVGERVSCDRGPQHDAELVHELGLAVEIGERSGTKVDIDVRHVHQWSLVRASRQPWSAWPVTGPARNVLLVGETGTPATVVPMIAYLAGTVLREDCVVTTGGVGYRVTCPNPLAVGETVALWVSTTVTSSGEVHLYGFADEADQQVFAALRSIQGVGPAKALSVLAALGAAGTVAALRDGDHKALAAAKGVSVAGAEKLCANVDIAAISHLADTDGPGPVGETVRLVAALTDLGRAESDARRVAADTVAAAGPDVEFPDLLATALRAS